jgi:hypothetical protein
VARFETPEGLLVLTPSDDDVTSSGPIHHLTDTRHRVVTYTALAASRFVDDFPSGAGLVFTRASEPETIDVPGSASPIPARPIAALPTFGWRRETGGTLTTSVRIGQGVRIYLDRPWFSSGEGELLGVVLWPADAAPPTNDERANRLRGAITQWGLDPVRNSGGLTPLPRLQDFPDATAIASRVTIPDLGLAVDVAGHPVFFDSDRGLWFCDITIGASTAYMPFVRLALARFQPHSIPGAEISAVALADFVQLAPDRSAVLIVQPDAPSLYKLVVSGFAALPSATAPWRSTIDLEIQQRTPGLGADLGWQTASPSAALVTPVDPPPSAPAVLFSGFIEFPAPPAPGTMRIVLRERETWEVDPVELLISVDPQFGAADQAAVNRFALTRRAVRRLAISLGGLNTSSRLVYADIIPVEPPSAISDRGDTAGRALEGDEAVPEDPPFPPEPSPPEFGVPDWAGQPAIDRVTRRTIVDGSVKLAQAMLNAAGASPLLAVDGNFGALTEAAVRAFRVQAGLPDASTVDGTVWLLLALAAPFPRLEPGPRNPPMTGPTIAVVQRLLNLTPSGTPIPEDGVYSPTTMQRVRDFQRGIGLTPTGVVDTATWVALASLTDLAEPTGTEQLTLEYDAALAGLGEPPIVLTARTPLSAAPPSSDRLDEDWTDRSGLWIEIRDGNGRPLYRRALSARLNLPIEHPAGAAPEELLSRPDSAPTTAAFNVTVPIFPAARVLAVFGATAGEADTPAILLATIPL